MNLKEMQTIDRVLFLIAVFFFGAASYVALSWW